MHIRRAVIRRSLAAALLLAAFTACGGDSSTPQPASPRREAGDVTVEGLAFNPETLEVAVGTTVTWTNDDPVQHTVTSGVKGTQGAPGVSKGKADRPDGTFDGALDDRGATFAFTFDEPGTYEYFCRIHGGMTGTIVVE